MAPLIIYQNVIIVPRYNFFYNPSHKKKQKNRFHLNKKKMAIRFLLCFRWKRLQRFHFPHKGIKNKLDSGMQYFFLHLFAKELPWFNQQYVPLIWLTYHQPARPCKTCVFFFRGRFRAKEDSAIWHRRLDCCLALSLCRH